MYGLLENMFISSVSKSLISACISYFLYCIYFLSCSVKFVTLCKLNYSLWCNTRAKTIYRQVERIKHGTLLEKPKNIWKVQFDLEIDIIGLKSIKIKGNRLFHFSKERVENGKHVTLLWKMEHCYKNKYKINRLFLKCLSWSRSSHFHQV